jgi:riboflavin kinase/FMN adenylyltransferase
MSKVGFAITIGNFDGLHLGHRALIETTVQASHSFAGKSALVTFDPHPQEVLGNRPIEKINSRFHQNQLLKQAGLDEVKTLPFNKAFSELSPEGFVKRFLVEPYKLNQVVVGYDFKFGCQRAGDFQTLKTLGKQFDFLVQEVPPLQLGGRTVSSTLIKQMIRENQFEQLPMYLGRPYGIGGVVELGDQRGRQLGFRTANINPNANLALNKGVYVSRVCWKGKRFLGVANFGTRPTFHNDQAMLETHLLDENIDLYGETIEVQPLVFLRKVKKFSGPDALKAQIIQDIQQTRNYLERCK